MAFICNICGEAATQICARCTKDVCANHICEKCFRCSDCCECEIALDAPSPKPVPMVHEMAAPAEPEAQPGQPPHSAIVGQAGSLHDDLQSSRPDEIGPDVSEPAH